MSAKYMSEFTCNVCNGERLGPEGRLVTVMGVRFPLASGMSFVQIRWFAADLNEKLPKEEKELVKEHIEAIISCADTEGRLGIGQLEMSRDISMILQEKHSALNFLEHFKTI